MSQHVAISPSEAADRLAIRELVDAYAYCADRRDAEGQMSLFTPDLARTLAFSFDAWSSARARGVVRALP